jgi:peroxin-2
LQDDYASEILLFLRAILFKLTIWDHNASYGASLQGLRYTNARDTSLARPPPTRWQKTIYGIITVFGRYGWSKWEDYLVDHADEIDYEPSSRLHKAERLTSLLSTAHSVTALFSFLVFLIDGKYRTLLDRILRLRLVPTSHATSREVSFEYLNRQLVWHAFTEFLLFLLPLVGIHRWRRILSRSWRKIRSFFLYIILGQSPNSAGDDEVKASGELGFLPERTCAICYKDQSSVTTAGTDAEVMAASVSGGVIGSSATDITNPYEAIPCGCIYCYACIVQRIDSEEGEGWVCLRCGETVNSCKPWNGDVLEETSRSHSSNNGKSVGFADSRGEHHEQDNVRHVEPIPEPDDEDVEINGTLSMMEASDNILADSELLASSTFDNSQAWAHARDESSGDEQSEEYDEEEDELEDDMMG